MSDEIQRSLGRIEGKLDTILDVQKTHATRLDDLDALKNRGYGIIAAITVAGGFMGASISKAIASIFHGTPH